MDLRKFISTTIREYLNEQEITNKINLNDKFVDSLKKELSNYNTSEELLRSGGISIETLDRLAHGFSVDDIKTLNPKNLKIKWVDDLENVKWEITQSGLTPKQWANKIDLTEPIDVSYWEDSKHKKGFYIEDGHHRYLAAKILNKQLNVNLEIKLNPIKVIAPTMGYDEFHRYIFYAIGNNKLNENKIKLTKDTITVFHGTQPKFVDDIKKNGLKDKTSTSYQQGWYMVSTDFNSALFHANPNEKKDIVYVFEFKIPIFENDRWKGYPYLWEGEQINDNSTWFALMKQIPSTFISKIHEVNYDEWINQKQKGF